MNLTADKLKQARDAGYSDDEIWGFVAEQDDRFTQAKDSGYSLDEVSGFFSEQPETEQIEAQVATEAPVGTSFMEEVRQIPQALQQSIEQPLEAVAETTEVLGASQVGATLRGLTEAPEGYIPAAQRLIEPQEGEFQIGGIAPQYIPRAAVEQAGQIVGAIASSAIGRTVGGLVGSVVGPVGRVAGATVGQFVGPALFEMSQIVGPAARERAANQGREEPTTDDLAWAWATAAGSGALNAVGARYLPNGDKLASGFGRRIAESIAAESTTEGIQEIVQQTGESFLTEQGLQIKPKEAIGAALTAGPAAGAATVIAEPFRAREVTPEVKAEAAAETQVAAQSAAEIAPATADVVSEQAATIIEEAKVEVAETPEQRVARLQEEATAAAGIELEEEGVGVEPPVTVTPPVEPTPEGAVAPVEPVVETVVSEPQPAAEVAVEPIVTPKEPLPEDKSVTILNYDERVKPIQDQIDAKLDELESGGMTFEEANQDPSVRALYEQRYAMDRGAINSYRDIVNRAFAAQGVTNDDLGFTPASSISEKVYGTPRKSDEGFISRVYETGQNAFNNDQATIKKLSEDIFKYRAENEGLDPAELLGPRSGLTDEGKKARVDEARIAAESIHNQIKNAMLEQSQAQPEALALPPAEVTPTPETPNLEPLRRVARAEQAPEDVPSLMDAGLVEVYKDQPVLTEAGIAQLPEAERPRLNPEARKIQIDTGSNEVVAEAIAKSLRIGVDQVGTGVRMPAGWTLVEDIYVPPTPQEVAPEVVAPTVEPITPEKQVVPQEQEQVVPVARVEQEQVNQGKPDVAKIINQFTVLERAAVAGKLLEEGYIDGRTADKFVKEATSEKTGGFSMQQIGDAQASADEKFNQQIAAARTSQPVAGEVSPAEVDLAAEDAARATKERISPTKALKPKRIVGETAREALVYLSSLNLVESKDWDADSGIARWRKDPNIPKPFYAQIQDAAAILSKLPLKLLDADKIVSNSERNRKGGAKRFGEGDIGIPLTETVRIQTATGAFVRRSVEKPLNVATLVHEVGHTLTADAVNKYITLKNPQGSEYLKVLDKAFKNKATPQPVKDLINLYKTTISQLGLEKEYFGKKGLAGGRAKDSQAKAYEKKIVNNLTGNPFTWSQYYGLANIDEFVAQAWSSQSFQDLLKQIKAPDQQSVWTKFTRIIRDLFGFPTDSMASAVIDVSMQVAELEAPVTTGMTVQERIDAESEAEPEQQPERVISFSDGSPEASTLSTMAASMAKVDAASEGKPNPENKPTYKISEIASVWMDQGGDTRQLQDLISENTNLTPANAKKVANAIAKQYDIQQSIAETAIETEAGATLEGLPEGMEIPKEVDPKRPKTVLQRVIDATTGVRAKPVKITGDEKALLKGQIRLKARETRESKKAQQETADAVVEAIKALELRGPMRPKQAQALAKRAAKVIWTSEKSMENFIAYAERVMTNTNYDADLREAKAAQKRAKELSKRETVAAPQRETLEAIANIGVNLLEDPLEYANVVNHYLRSFKPVTSESYVVVPDAEMKSYLSGAEDIVSAAKAEFEAENNERLAAKYGISVDELKKYLDSDDIMRALETYAKREVIEGILNEKSAGVKEALKGVDLTTMREDQRKLIKAMMDIDYKSLDSAEKQSYVRIGNNIIFNNNQTNGAEFFVATAQGQQAARDLAKNTDAMTKNKAWANIAPALGSRRAKKVLKSWAEELQSVADTFRNAFGKKAMTVFYEAMGMVDLDLGFTAANRVLEEIQEKMAKFYDKLDKKYKQAARDQDGILSEGIAGYLIQNVPEKEEGDSLAQRRNLIQQDIIERRKSGDEDRMQMADRVEAILQKIDGENVDTILANLKREYPANYESLMWLKDELFPQYKEFLKRFDENFNDQANNYNTPNYLPISYMTVGPSIDLLQSTRRYYDSLSSAPKQSSYTIKRSDYTQLPLGDNRKPKEIGFNLRSNAYNSLSDQITKAYTNPAWQRIDSFLKTPEAEEALGGQANKDFFAERINRLKQSRERRGSINKNTFDKAVDIIATLGRAIGTRIALAGSYQLIRQPSDQVTVAVGVTGRADLMAEHLAPRSIKSARPLIDLFSIGRRGDASSGYKYINQMEGAQSRLERYFTEGRWVQAKEAATRLADKFMLPLKASDFHVAAATWMTLYRAYLAKNKIPFNGWEDAANKIKVGDVSHRRAAGYAENMTDIYQGSSDPTKMATFAQKGKTGSENLLKAILVPFNSFGVQFRSRISSEMTEIMNRSGDWRGKALAIKDLSATIGGTIMFGLAKRFALPALTYGGIKILYAIFGVDVEEPDEEKQKEEFDRKWKQLYGDVISTMIVGGGGQMLESYTIDGMNYIKYMIDSANGSEDVLDDDGEIMSFNKYAKERAPFYRYRSFDNAMSLGILDIGMDQARKSVLNTKMVLTPDEMDKYTPEEQAFLYVALLSDWLYLGGFNDADFARMWDKARRDMINARKEEEKELKRIRSGR